MGSIKVTRKLKLTFSESHHPPQKKEKKRKKN